MPPGRRTLLLADDSPTIQKVISLTFADEGLEVIAVGGGDEALRVLEEAAPDIVLADAVMPGLDGYGLCERIKGDARFRHIPVMLLVGTFEPFNEAEARRVGADTVLTKPFQSIRDLVSKVGSLLGGGDAKHEDEAAADAVESRRAASPADEAIVREADVPVGRRAPEAPEPSGEALREGEHAGGFGDRTASFADIEMDDQMIEARPAEAFGGNTARKESAGVESEPFGEEEVPGFLKMRADLMGEGRAASVAATSSHEPEESFAARPVFASRMADAAAADETLLDLGDISPPGASDEADDFILDLADDSPLGAAPASSHAGAGFSETPFFDEPDFDSDTASHASADAPSAFAEASHGEPTPPEPPHHLFDAPAGWEISPTGTEAVTQDEPQTPIWADASDAFNAPDEPREESGMALSQMGRAHEFIEPQVVPADIPVPSEVLAEFTDGSVEGDVAKSPAAPDSFNADSTASSSAASSTAETSSAETPTTEAHAHDESALRAESGHSPEGLSPEAVDAIARRVVELMSEKVIREIAWEVVPDLAELLIKRRLDEEKR